MGIRFPLKTVLSVDNGIIATGPASTVGGVAHLFTIPQDSDNIVVKLNASIKGGGVSATLQTTDNGGTTWYDVARTSIISDGALPQWLSSPVIGVGVRTTTVPGTVPSVGGQAAASINGAIGVASASTLGQLEVSGLPILSSKGRVFLRNTAAVTSIISETVRVYVNNESGTS